MRSGRFVSSLACAGISLACPSGPPPESGGQGTRSVSAGGSAPEPSAESPRDLARPGSGASAAPHWGLPVSLVGGMRETERGGTLVVLLHGWGAQGDDLVPLARELSGPGARFVIPAAPLERADRRRAWWHLSGQSRPPFARPGEAPNPASPVPLEVATARRAVLQLIETARRRYAPDRVCVAGFSQGAMLALDVGLVARPPLDCVGVMSGGLLSASLSSMAEGRRPSLLIAHGRQDSVVSFERARTARQILEARGHAVTWVPFSGGHGIPASVRTALRRFLFDAGSASSL